jgi:hypothetical protein
MRLFLVLNTTYLWDEDREWIILARSISFTPSTLSLPIQGDTHPILPAYLMHMGTLLWGENPLGFRFFSLLAGCLTVMVASRLAWRVAGATAGLATGLLLAMSEYHMVMSSVAVDGVFYLLFSLLALTAFTSFLRQPQAAALLETGVFAGLGYMCNERAGLLLPVFGIFLLTSRYRRWLWRWPSWVALLLFLAVISPDLLKGWVGDDNEIQAGYGDHLDRFAGVGISPQPAAFYGKTAVRTLVSVTGHDFMDWAPEYPAMNEITGLALFMGIFVVLWSREKRKDPAVRLWLALFFFVFFFLVLLKTENNPEKNLGPQAWYWADLTLLPAALLMGVAVGRLAAWPRRVVTLLLLAGCLVSSARLGLDRFGIQRLKLGVEPAILRPLGDRSAEVRVAILPCVVCDPTPAATLEKVMVQTESGWRPAAPGEVQRAEPGVEQRLLLQAGNSITAYGLHYRLTEKSGKEMKTSIGVLVRPGPPRYNPPFWVSQRLAREEHRP